MGGLIAACNRHIRLELFDFDAELFMCITVCYCLRYMVQVNPMTLTVAIWVQL